MNLLFNSRRLAILVIFFSALLSIPTNLLLAADAPPKPPELKVLDKLVGGWTTQSTVTVADAQPQNLKTTGATSRKWALDGRFVEESGTSSDGGEFRTIVTFDANRKAYRLWYFNSTGTSVEMAGQWDEAKQTLSFKADLGNNVTQIATLHFIDNDTYEFNSKVVDNAGKVYFDVAGRNKRKI